MAKKILIASDVHGSAFWCKRLQTLIETENPDVVCLLGDLLYHGPRNPLPKNYDPQTVAEILNAYTDRIVAVRGNCDAEVDQLLLSFPARADYAVLTAFERKIFLTHGHLFDLSTPPPLQSGDVLFNGHTHLPKVQPMDNGAIYVNCGSVSLPKESPHSAVVWTEDGIRFINLEDFSVFSTHTL